MNPSIQEILEQTYELEGMLHVAAHHGERTEMVVYSAIREKVTELMRMVACIDIPDTEDLFDYLPEDEPDEDISLEFIDEEGFTEEAPQEKEEESNTISFDFHDEPEVPQPEAEAEEPRRETYEEYAPAIPEEYARYAPKMPEDEADTIETAEEAEEAEAPAPVVEAHVVVVEPEPVVVMPAEPAPADDDDKYLDLENQEEETGNEYEPVEDALSPEKRLRRMFTIGDRYRFRRELFSNSDAEMNEALNLISVMATFDEVEEYFYYSQGWDKMMPEVEEFMAIVQRFFQNRIR